MNFVVFMLKVRLLPSHSKFGSVDDDVGCNVYIAGEDEHIARAEMLRFLQEQHLMLRREIEWKFSHVPDSPTGDDRVDSIFRRVVAHGRALDYWVKSIDPTQN